MFLHVNSPGRTYIHMDTYLMMVMMVVGVAMTIPSMQGDLK